MLEGTYNRNGWEVSGDFFCDLEDKWLTCPFFVLIFRFPISKTRTQNWLTRRTKLVKPFQLNFGGLEKRACSFVYYIPRGSNPRLLDPCFFQHLQSLCMCSNFMKKKLLGGGTGTRKRNQNQREKASQPQISSMILALKVFTRRK